MPPQLRSHLLADNLLKFFEARIVALVERPLLDPFRHDQIGLRQNSHVLAQGWLADLELFGDTQIADAVFDEVAIDLWRKMRNWISQPNQDLQPTFIGQRAKNSGKRH